ncbi:sulfurtransferase [Gordonia jinhuaensis]|uniref:Sulfurtransferase n=1 Tax=Gordonia jinhuaensis TaxID=1517702 RepID=A0A916WUG1_9ACTN|nr:sulfurtransferase [Gordonia jinhuaensis]GGB30824.1 sulfurtransferase [Gordonia jinhuaensis]
MSTVIVDAAAVKAELDQGNVPTLLDVRWKLGDDNGLEHYRAAHIPGAIYVDLDTELAAPATEERGRHPLPEIGALQDSVRRWGIDADTPVVVYDDNASQSAARAWWLLRWAGLDDVRILDGGLNAWTQAGYPVATGDEAAATDGTAQLSPGHLPVADIDATARAAAGSDTVVLDARAPERYRGEIEPVDRRAGHIPGAVSAPTAANVDDTGRFRSADQLRRRFADIGVTPGSTVVVYCGSGVTAAHEVAALTQAGTSAALFPGSWSQWSADDHRPVAVGDTPS